MKLPKIVAAVWEPSSSLDQLNVSHVTVAFLLNCDLISLQGYIKQLKRWKKKVFVDLDLVQGLSGEEYSVRYVSLCGIDGIITIKPRVVDIARKLGVTTVMRSFLLDSTSISRLEDTLKNTRPDFLEILPGCAFCKGVRVIDRITNGFRPKLIGAGLIDTKEEALAILNMGAVAISTSNPELWRINHEIS